MILFGCLNNLQSCSFCAAGRESVSTQKSINIPNEPFPQLLKLRTKRGVEEGKGWMELELASIVKKFFLCYS